MAQNRATFERLAELRLEEARLLLTNGQPSGAYYLAGYAIECALKVFLAAEFRKNEIPDLKRVQNIHTHDLSALLSLAGLKAELDVEKDKNPDIYERWTIVRTWSEKARYEIWTEASASAILEAVSGNEGFLQWLRNRW